jgi:hypothetical protein
MTNAKVEGRNPSQLFTLCREFYLPRFQEREKICHETRELSEYFSFCLLFLLFHTLASIGDVLRYM